MNTINILFVCHGNICRSPMAEFIMKDIVQKTGHEKLFHIESAATSCEEIGNEVYPLAKHELAKHNISCKGKTARQVTKKDYQKFDIIICMDSNNIANIMHILDHDKENKIHKLMNFTSRPGDVADPWYTGNFSITWNDIYEGCQCLLKRLLSPHPLPILISK